MSDPNSTSEATGKSDFKDIKPTREFADLVRIMEILRVECPWDRKQTHESIKDLMVEEIYEAIDAIDQSDFDELRKELGDILLHIVFHAEMAREKGKFTIGDVIYGIQDKLIRRHPHVFGDITFANVNSVMKNWESIKMKEGGRKSVLQGVPVNLPALLRAQRMQEKAGGVGFDWKEWEPAWEKLLEELNEFRSLIKGASAGTPELSEKDTKTTDLNRDNLAGEFGDVLFSVVNVGRLLGLNAEDSLRLTNTKFQSRFHYIEQKLAEKNLRPDQVSLEEMDILWDEAKSLEQADT